MHSSTTDSFVPLERILRMALGKEATDDLPLGLRRGLGALLAFHRDEQGDSLSLEERRAVAVGATTWSVLEQTLQEVASVFERKAIGFAVLKGAALAPLYPLPELRPTSDLDLLIHHHDLETARELLTAEGWEPMVHGKFAEAYLQQEGSCWQAFRNGRLVIELHFRLWGSVPEPFAERVLSAAIQRTDSHSIPSPSHCLVIAAAHGYRQATPRRASDHLDICLLLEHHSREGFRDLLREAAHSGQQLPVALALETSARLLEQTWVQDLAAEAASTLRLAERRVLRDARVHGSDAVAWPKIRLAMLLARRPSRAGWRSLTRQLWPHPGIVEQRTPSHLSWAARRAVELRRKVQSYF